MNISTLIRPVAAASFSLLATTTMKQEMLRPVAFPGQTLQQSPDVYATSVYGHHLSLLCRHVHQFLALADNWDGYGAVPPSVQAVGNVLDLLNRLPGGWTAHLHPDDVTPSPYGTISLEWAQEADYVRVEVGDASWAFTGEMAGLLQTHSNETYPNEALRQRVAAALAGLYPDAIPHDAPAYSA